MNIPSHLFEAFLKCPTKCHLRSLSEAGTANPYAEWVGAHNESYRSEAARRLQEGVPETERVVAPPATENFKAAKWRLAVQIVAQSRPVWAASSGSVPLQEWNPGGTPPDGIRTDETSALHSQAEILPPPIGRGEGRSEGQKLESRLHAVERVPSEERGKPAQFVPIRFVSTNKLTKNDRLLLAFDALVLSEMLGREVSLGKIIHGDDRVTLKVKFSPLLGDVRKLIAKMAALLASGSAPDLVLNRHCAECEFRDRCRQKAMEKDDLSLLGGMTEKERKKYHSKGIFTVTQLSYTFRPRRRPKRLRDKREKYHHSLKALAIREKKIHIVGSPELKIKGTPVCLDVEGLPDRDFYYLIGVRFKTGDAVAQHSLWADGPDDERTIWNQFLDILGSVENPVLVHYGSYETTFLKRMRERHGGAPENSAAAKAIGSAVNLLSVIFAQIYFPTYSNGLKEIGSWLGAKWQMPNPSGIQTLVWRHTWEASRSDDLRQQLLAYNQDDCQAGFLLADELRRTGEELASRKDVDFVDAPKRCATERGAEIHRVFTEILESAHADYEGKRIHIQRPHADKTEAEVRPVRVSPVRARNFPSVAAKVIKVPKKRTCSRHRKQALLPTGKMVEHGIIDLAFTKNGCRKTLTKYVGNQVVCPTCGREYGPPAIRRLWGRIFGHKFQAWAVYQRVTLRLPFDTISIVARDLFSEDINSVTLINFLNQFAIEYATTEGRLLEHILSGPVIHVDETKISICGENQYVWVLTDGQRVIFRLSATRETRIVREILDGYQGTLVSDFYGGYDAIPCRQQKCLVHLIRDLNDDLWKHPFDLGYESFVVAVRELLKPVFEDIDRFGLKARHLRKHRRAVQQFYERVILVDAPRSETTATYQKRFIRYRDSLFSFLDADGVPWNNNIAERALRHLAIQRKISGSFFATGAERYLRLLGISQTCRFQNKSFLHFLLSGSHDVDTYKEGRRRNQPRRRRAVSSQPF